ncbi:hypothetical protein [Methanosarcina barkeri]|uniref:hypothetical protein n=1 Tax=Methanosarcina barkeri TaxID=2208 RepID=UPI0006D136C2|nr:hypothetical protein [Methanosarcina barkeri]
MLSFLSKVKTFNLSVKEDELKDENDKVLFRLIPEALSGIEETARLFKRTAGIEEETVGSVLINVLKGKQDLVSFMDRLNVKAKSLKEETLEVEAELQRKKGERDLLNELHIQVEKAVDKALNDNDLELEEYFSQKEKLKVLQEHEYDLKTKIDAFLGNLKEGNIKSGDKDSWLLMAGVPGFQRELETLSRDLDLNLNELGSLLEAIALYSFYDYKINRLENAGIKEKVLVAIKGNKTKSLRNYEAKKRNKEEYIKSTGREYLQINSPFELSVPESFLSESLDRKSEELKDKVLKSLFFAGSSGFRA